MGLCQPQVGEHNSEDLLSGPGATEALLSSATETFGCEGTQILKISAGMRNMKGKDESKIVHLLRIFFSIKIIMKKELKKKVFLWGAFPQLDTHTFTYFLVRSDSAVI